MNFSSALSANASCSVTLFLAKRNYMRLAGWNFLAVWFGLFISDTDIQNENFKNKWIFHYAKIRSLGTRKWILTIFKYKTVKIWKFIKNIIFHCLPLFKVNFYAKKYLCSTRCKILAALNSNQQRREHYIRHANARSVILQDAERLHENCIVGGKCAIYACPDALSTFFLFAARQGRVYRQHCTPRLSAHWAQFCAEGAKMMSIRVIVHENLSRKKAGDKSRTHDYASIFFILC